LAVFALVALSPVAWALRRPPPARSRRDAAMALHRAQLAELARDLAQAQISEADHAQAVLEVQRRLLAAADAPDAAPTPPAATPLVLALIGIPLLAAALYAIDGHPSLPAAPLAARQADAAHEAALIAQLRTRLATLDPQSDVAREGFMLLGNAEAHRGNLAQAAAAWRQAVTVRFDAGLAALAAEAQFEADGSLSDDSATLLRRALREAAPDAPWRALAEQRLAAIKPE